MKIINSLLTVLMLAVMAACGGGNSSTTEETTEDTKTGESVTTTYAVSMDSSEFYWLGEVAGVYGHDGYIKLSDGTVTVTDGAITDGMLTIDMTTIEPANPEEYADEDGKRASDLKAHLSTGDFFLVEEYPTATFKIKSQSGDKLIGDLTIRGNTKEETATITSMEATPEGMTATASLVFNRQDYEVAWVHFMKDMVLSDDIKVDIKVVGTPQ